VTKNTNQHPHLKKTLKRSILVFTAISLSACSTLHNTDKPMDIIAAYSLFAPASDGSTLLYARAVLDDVGTHCPVLNGSDQSVIKMSPRGLRPDADNFPVTVCEAIISPGISYQIANTFKLAAAKLAPKSVLVYGDSGCEAGVCDDGAEASPFAQLAKEGTGSNAQLILHMGDFNYRGTSGALQDKPTEIYAYDAGDGGYDGPICGYVDNNYYSQNARDSSRPDQWQYWYEDFFLPAKALLPTAPWVFSRGNHELCSRAGIGWFYFFGPGSSISGGIAQMACPEQGTIAMPANNAVNSISMVQPYKVSLQPVDLWVMDSANACDASADNPLTAQYSVQFDQLMQMQGSATKPVWMVTHRPIWGASVDTSGSTPSISATSVMLQTALKQSKSSGFPAAVQLTLSGHMHLYQDVSFPDRTRPPQIVVGNSGVSLEQSATGDYQASIDGEPALINQLDSFGYLLMSLQSDGSWQGSILNGADQVLVSCDSSNVAAGKALCRNQSQ
jgi:hypothetical protein